MIPPFFIKVINYRYFMYDGLKHTCIEGSHIVNVFSFSKAYGMMGWRVGYVSVLLMLNISLSDCTKKRPAAYSSRVHFFLFCFFPELYL